MHGKPVKRNCRCRRNKISIARAERTTTVVNVSRLVEDVYLVVAFVVFSLAIVLPIDLVKQTFYFSLFVCIKA